MDTNVGTRKLFENDEIIMWEFLLEPGEATSCHTHVHDYVFHVLEGSREQIEAQLRHSIDAFFDFYPEI